MAEGIDKGTYKGLGAFDSAIETLSTASTVLTLTLDQQGKTLLWGGQAAASRIVLPQAQLGLVYTIVYTDDAFSSATMISCSGGTDDIYYSHVDQVQTTGQGVSYGSTLEGGQRVELTGISSVRWMVTDNTRTTLVASGIGTQAS